MHTITETVQYPVRLLRYIVPKTACPTIPKYIPLNNRYIKMVSLKDVETANASIGATFPPEIVAVFVGATSGIGESTLLQFAKYTTTLRPRVYFVGRSQEAGDRLVETCKKLNSNGQFSFIQADTSLIRNVDEICREIAKKEKYINILCMSSGTLLFNTKTSEGLHMAVSLVTYSRNRFAK